MGIEQLQTKKQTLLTNLEQIRTRIEQLSQELAQRQAQENQTLGALMFCDELMAENSKNENNATETAQRSPGLVATKPGRTRPIIVNHPA